LPPRGVQAWPVLAAPKPPLTRRDAAPLVAPPPTLDALVQSHVSADFWVTGSGAPGTELRLVVDDDMARAQLLQPDGAGRWRARVNTDTMLNPEVPHTLVLWAGGQAVSERRPFWVLRDWKLLADVEDPAGDERGPTGRDRHPSDAGQARRGHHRQMGRHADLRRVRAFSAGDALRLDLTTRWLTTGSKPTHGFDEVVFTVFIELPNALGGGATVMPLQNASLPAGMRWHLRLRVSGWGLASVAAFAPDGASATYEGRALWPVPALKLDADAHTVSLLLPASLLSVAGQLPVLSGARIYVTTWGDDGAGTSDGAKVADDSVIIVLP
jgi:C-terminal binding-module, SLH-like, of glucodextranase